MKPNRKFHVTYYNNVIFLSRNFKKKHDGEPDCVGAGQVEGIIYNIAGWEKVRKDGSSYMRLWLKRCKKENARTEPDPEWRQEYRDFGVRGLKKNAKVARTKYSAAGRI